MSKKYKNWKPEAINCPTLHSQCQMMAFRILSINPRQNPRSRYDLEMFSYVLDDLDTISIFRNWLKRSRSRYDLHVYADFSNDPILSQHSVGNPSFLEWMHLGYNTLCTQKYENSLLIEPIKSTQT